MLRAIIHNRLSAAERDLGESMDYAREIVDASLPAFFKFAKVLGMNEHRKVLPIDVWHVAKIVTSRAQDCGPCVRIAERMAEREGVADAVVVAARDGRYDALSPELATVARFARAVNAADHTEAPFREELRGRYGKAGLVELALAIASSQIFPTLKRALGHSEACEIPVDESTTA